MRIARHVVARKKQSLVALPAEVRRHLGLTPGAMVWWHVGRKGMVSLTTSGRVRAGRPHWDEDCPTCVKLRAELERLRREVRDGESATPGQYWRGGYARALGDLGNFKADGELTLHLVKWLVSRERSRGGASVPRASRPRRRTVRTPGPDDYAGSERRPPPPPVHEEGAAPARHAPDPPPPDVAVSEGEAVTSGPSVPGHPIES